MNEAVGHATALFANEQRIGQRAREAQRIVDGRHGKTANILTVVVSILVSTFFAEAAVRMADGQPLMVHPDKDGALAISLPAKDVTVIMEFREPERVRYAAGLTVLGWISIGALLIKRRPLFEFTPPDQN